MINGSSHCWIFMAWIRWAISHLYQQTSRVTKNCSIGVEKWFLRQWNLAGTSTAWLPRIKLVLTVLDMKKRQATNMYTVAWLLRPIFREIPTSSRPTIFICSIYFVLEISYRNVITACVSFECQAETCGQKVKIFISSCRCKSMPSNFKK